MYSRPSENTCLYKLFVTVLATSLHVGVKSENDFEYCPDGWTYYGPTNKCFKFFQSFGSHSGAASSCKSLNGFLAEPTSINETKFMCEVASELTSYMLVGIMKSSENILVYERLSTPVDTNIIDWDVGQPASVTCKCTVITKDCKWHDATCSGGYHICEQIDVNSCQTNNGNCDNVCVQTGFRKNKCVSPCSFSNGGCAEICQEKGKRTVCSCKTGHKIVNITQCIKDPDYKPDGEGSLLLPISLLVLAILLLIAGAAFFMLKGKSKQELGSNKNTEKKSATISGGEEEEEPKPSEDVAHEVISEQNEEADESVKEMSEVEPVV